MQFVVDIALILIYLCGFFLLCAWAWNFWLLYVGYKSSVDWSMFEIKLPSEIMKSPLAMEMALASLLQGGGLSPAWYKQLFKGASPIYSSLEIASLEGVIHFYVRVQKRFRPLVESNLYAQYPGIEIVEADDYTKRIRYHHLSEDTKIWGVSFFLGKTWKPTNADTGEVYKKDGKEYSMRADFYPIKTYVDYGLDKDPKEEFKNDPLTPLLEFMGSVGKGEYVWYQVLVQDESIYNGTKRSKFFVNSMSGKSYNLKELAEERKKQIRTSGYVIKGEVSADEFGVPKIIESFDKNFKQEFIEETKDGKVVKVPKKIMAKYLETKAVSKKEQELTADEKDEIEAINKKISKPIALVVIRLIYIAKSQNYNGAHVNSVLSAYKPFNGINSFGLSPTDPYDYPWQTLGGKRIKWRGEEKFDAYVNRDGFFTNYEKATSGFWDINLWEDSFFWSSSSKTRQFFHAIYNVIFHPFQSVTNTEISFLNMEELATIWHFPGATATTPTLPRIESMKGVAPVNLPL